jgi:uncharacterized protein YbjT (DUF2867 family)
LTGATGYIGGRLLGALEARGTPIRCLVRRPDFLRARVGADTEVVPGDVLDPESLGGALAGVWAAYYLVHSMGAGASFEDEDRRAALAFGAAAREAGVGRIIYLGGLGHGEALSPHLASRQEVGRLLRESGVPTIEFRASIVIGSGSFSFEMVRALVDRLPVMTTPRWVHTPAQPIAIEDVIEYLLLGLEVPITGSTVFEIGGRDVVSYLDLMREYARQRGLRRLIVPVPVLTPWLSSLWLGLVTPLYARVGRALIEGVRNPTMVRDDAAQSAFALRPRGMRGAVERALRNEDQDFAVTRWSDAVSSLPREPRYGGATVGSRLVDSHAVHVPLPPRLAFATVRRAGGTTGWYFANWLWRLRGWMDLAAGGAGMRRGRRDPEHVRPGDPVDWWRVEAFEPDRLLRLRAEMRLPGRAWLQFEVDADGRGGSTLRQTALFEPRGVLGRAYWYALYPVHFVVFTGMLRAMRRAALRETGAADAGAAAHS